MGTKDDEENSRLTGRYWNIAQEREKNKCVFCDLKDKYVIVANENAILTVNIFPYIDGQLLIVPKRHIERFEDLTNEEAVSFHDLTKSGIKLLNERLGITNVWIIIRDGDVAGKTIKHLHTNIMPYKDGLNTWHYQEINISPASLAEKLRS